MPERQVTIRAVAEAAGVSMSTVSNVLSGRHEQMAAETRERVLAVIERLNYQPNYVARSLVTRRTATIGLIMSEVTNSLYPPVTVGAEAACREAGYGLLLANAEDDASERRGVELMRAKQVDALIVFSISLLAADSQYLDDTPGRRHPGGGPQSRPLTDHRRSRRSGLITRPAATWPPSIWCVRTSTHRPHRRAGHSPDRHHGELERGRRGQLAHRTFAVARRSSK